jgi:hypothetical protein
VWIKGVVHDRASWVIEGTIEWVVVMVGCDLGKVVILPLTISHELFSLQNLPMLLIMIVVLNVVISTGLTGSLSLLFSQAIPDVPL